MNDSTHQEAFDPRKVGPRLEAARLALSLTKAQMAEVIDIDASSYSKIIKGAKPLLPPQAWRLWKAYSVDPNFIYLGQLGGLPVDLSRKLMPHLRGAQE